MKFTPKRELPQSYSQSMAKVFQTFTLREQERQAQYVFTISVFQTIVFVLVLVVLLQT